MLDVTMLLTGHISWHLHEEKEERLKKGKTTRRRGGEKNNQYSIQHIPAQETCSGLIGCICGT
jgi:hypothetical protein